MEIQSTTQLNGKPIHAATKNLNIMQTEDEIQSTKQQWKLNHCNINENSLNPRRSKQRK